MTLLPLPTKTSHRDPCTQAATEITLIHNSLIRALNSIYIQCPRVPLSEYPNFTSYALATYRGLVAHNSSTLSNELARDTRAFDTPLTAWRNWLQSIASKKNNFNSQLCRSLMDDFMAALHTHFETVSHSLLHESQPQLDIAALMKEHKNKVFGNTSKTEVLPVFVLNHDEMFGGERHEVWMARGWVVRKVYARKKGEWWKFSTVGRDGGKREVRFVGEA